MEPKTITLLLNALIGVFLILGFIFGAKRGIVKSSLRLGFLMFDLLFCLFLAPLLSSAILEADISGLVTLSAGGQTFNTLNEFMSYFMEQNAVMIEFFNSNPIMKSFIIQIPLVITNFVVFMVGFFVIKLFTFPMYLWCSSLITKKMNKEECPKEKTRQSRFFGGILGVLQGALVAMVVFLPLSAASMVFYDDNPAYAEEAETGITSSLTLGPESMEFLNVYNGTVISNTLNAFGLNKINEYLFTELSSISINGVKIKLVQEIKIAASTMIKINKVIETYELKNISTMNETELIRVFSTMDYEEIEQILNELFELNSLDLLGDEIVNIINTKILENTETIEHFNENNLPEIQSLVNSALLTVGTSNISTLKADLLGVVAVLKVLQQNGTFNFIENDAMLEDLQYAIDIEDKESVDCLKSEIINYAIESLNNFDELTIRNIFSAAFRSQTIRTLMPNIMTAVTAIINKTLSIDIPLPEYSTITWANETTRLAKIVYNAKGIITSIDAFITGEIDFTLDYVKEANFEKIGIALNSMRDSQLISHIYYGVIVQVLESEFVKLTQDKSIEFEFEYIDISTINWQTEFKNLQSIITDFVNITDNVDIDTLDFSKVNFLKLQSAINLAFKSELSKEIISQIANVLPYKLVKNAQNGIIDQDGKNVIDKILLKTENMNTEDYRKNMLILVSVLDSIQKSATANSSSIDLMSIIENYNQHETEQLLKNLLSSDIVCMLIPDFINIGITKMNTALNADIPLVDSSIILSTADIQKLATILYNTKTIYFNYKQAKESGENVSILELLQSVGIEKGGIILDTLKTMTIFKDVYTELVNQIVCSEKTLGVLFTEDIINQIKLTTAEINKLNWTEEFLMIKDAISLGVKFKDFPVVNKNSIDLKTFLTDHANSKFVKMFLAGFVKKYFAHADLTKVYALNLFTSAVYFDTLFDIVFNFVDFSLNEYADMSAQQIQNLTTLVAYMDKDKAFNTFIQDITELPTLRLSQYSGIINYVLKLINGQKIIVKDMVYTIEGIDIMPFINWAIEFSKNFSMNQKLPYYINIDCPLFFYQYHLGKTQEVGWFGSLMAGIFANPIKNYILQGKSGLVPDTLTLQLVYDYDFVQPVEIVEIE
ncbi:MAG: hypothetical protein WCX32_01470 [Clostridia bacterium]